MMMVPVYGWVVLPWGSTVPNMYQYWHADIVEIMTGTSTPTPLNRCFAHYQLGVCRYLHSTIFAWPTTWSLGAAR